jgi:hypothetical protein
MSDLRLIKLPLPQTPDSKLRRDILVMTIQLEVLDARLERVPTRGDLARVALAIIFCTAVVTSLFGWWLMVH